MQRRIQGLLIILTFLATSPGCAGWYRENLPLTDRTLGLQSGAKYALVPLTYPLDLVVTHPLFQAVPDAAIDTNRWLFDFTLQDHYYTEVSFLPFRAIGAMVIFPLDWLGRSLFAFEPNPVTPSYVDTKRETPDPALRGTKLQFVQKVEKPSKTPISKEEKEHIFDTITALSKLPDAVTVCQEARTRFEGLSRAAVTDVMSRILDEEASGNHEPEEPILWATLLAGRNYDLRHKADAIRHVLATHPSRRARDAAAELLRLLGELK